MIKKQDYKSLKIKSMAKQKEETETKYIEMDIPQDIITDTAEMIEENEIEAALIGTGNEEDCVRIGFEYEPKQREVIVEILEMIQDYNNDTENEEEEEED
jgi:hypothetical protein